MRLVDADALIEVTFCIEGDVREGIIMTPLEVVHEYTKAIDTAPTIDAEPVRTGKWIDETFEPWGLVHHPDKCDQCGEHSESDSNYCPWCGADMRGDQK